ncbi:glycosyltransferase family 4 protein [Aerolutibacter ruishenii]|uniref:Glycosyltransferase involved in cell wall biosynthesis n=1 Tax=Aerolutibacter ruishenii TaxID=686800 RepID=A0A562LXU1_9GAMM|nr:glycosyltransferase family 4 protein [Lysobacter ruishenii]TWI12469.1 glycosyltransferase involved in cell wall biosynthesis [Lysobacter ruishenii]
MPRKQTDPRAPFIPPRLPDAGRGRIHVLMVLESRYPVPLGGAEAQVRTLAKALRARGHRVTILTPLIKDWPVRRETIFRVDRVPVCRIRFPRIRWLGGAILCARLAMFLWARRKRYDAWHVHIVHRFGAVCGLLGRLVGKPVILKVSGAWELEQGALATAAPWTYRILHRCLLWASAWQAISNRIASTIAARGIPPARIASIPNAVDTARYRTITRASSPFPRFVFVGRMVPEKDLGILLQAFADALPSCPSAQLKLVGTGPLLASLQSLATDLRVASNVEFCGQREDIEEVLSDADIGVLTSRIEGLSNALLECMAAGLPMIASRVSGSEDLVRTGCNGWMFEPGDRRGLAAAMVEAATVSHAQRAEMGLRARESVELHAGLDNVIEKLLALYRQPEVPARAQYRRHKRLLR